MLMITVYCDNNGFRKGLNSLPNVKVLTFPYENYNRKIKNNGLPSEAQIDDLGNFTWDTLPATFGDYKRSDKYEEIEKIVGTENRLDALHLDSAYKSGCECFFTCDKTDIGSKRVALFNLLGLRIYHPDEDWEAFLAFVNHRSSI